MSTWMELHCDVLRDSKPGDGWKPPRCYSHDNNNPGVMVGNTLERIRRGRDYLVDEAKERGWKCMAGIGWVCPHCQVVEP